jgi:CelD/BcsL family acetyltransferase involved in cellulose biosynthesis
MTQSLVIHARTTVRPAAPSGARADIRPGASHIVIDVVSDLSLLEQEWRAFEQCADCTAFQSFDWLSTWQACIGERKGARPAIVTGRSPSGELLFLLPLATESAGPLRRLVFLGRDLCDYNAPLLSPSAGHLFSDDFHNLWSRITTRLQTDARHRHDLVLLDKMPRQVGHQANPFCHLSCRPNPSGAYLATLAATWDAFYEQKRSGSSRKRDRQRQRRLAALGEVSFATVENPNDRRATLGTLMVQKRQAFARMGVTDIFSRAGYEEFFHAIAQRAPDLIHIGKLKVGETPAAANMGLLFRNRFYHVLISYDAGPISRAGPGTAHLHALMRHAVERGCTTFDFTIGDEPYKREWSDVELTLYDHVAPVTILGTIVAVPLDALRTSKRYIKQSPRLWNLATKTRAFLRRGKSGVECSDTRSRIENDG